MAVLKRILKLVAAAALALLILLVVLLELPFLGASAGTGDVDYSHWMRETLSGPERLVDIAMLGAHDALTAEMQRSSKVDAASVAAPFQLGICKSLGYRQSKTQLASVSELLAGGVRYFDLRVTRDADTGEFYTVHNYYGAPLAQCLAAFTAFLAQHPGEVLILDFQHCYDATAADGLLTGAHGEELDALVAQSGLLAYAQTPRLADATYGEVTASGSRAACLILRKNVGDSAVFLDYAASIYSPWSNTDSAGVVFDDLDARAADVEAGAVSRDVFRVQQAVLTMQASPSGICKAIASWSLLRRAQGFNARLADRQQETWLRALPIVMTDHTLSTRGGAHARLMEQILAYDRALA